MATFTWIEVNGDHLIDAVKDSGMDTGQMLVALVEGRLDHLDAQTYPFARAFRVIQRDALEAWDDPDEQPLSTIRRLNNEVIFEQQRVKQLTLVRDVAIKGKQYDVQFDAAMTDTVELIGLPVPGPNGVQMLRPKWWETGTIRIVNLRNASRETQRVAMSLESSLGKDRVTLEF